MNITPKILTLFVVTACVVPISALAEEEKEKLGGQVGEMSWLETLLIHHPAARTDPLALLLARNDRVRERIEALVEEPEIGVGARGQIGSELTLALRDRHGDEVVLAADLKGEHDLSLRDSGACAFVDVTVSRVERRHGPTAPWR